jgi:hypothetical protein
MENIKHKSCNNRVKLTIIPKYSITNTKVNSTLTNYNSKNYSIIMPIQQNNKFKKKNSRIKIKINGKN